MVRLVCWEHEIHRRVSCSGHVLEYLWTTCDGFHPQSSHNNCDLGMYCTSVSVCPTSWYFIPSHASTMRVFGMAKQTHGDFVGHHLPIPLSISISIVHDSSNSRLCYLYNPFVSTNNDKTLPFDCNRPRIPKICTFYIPNNQNKQIYQWKYTKIYSPRHVPKQPCPCWLAWKKHRVWPRIKSPYWNAWRIPWNRMIVEPNAMPITRANILNSTWGHECEACVCIESKIMMRQEMMMMMSFLQVWGVARPCGVVVGPRFVNRNTRYYTIISLVYMSIDGIRFGSGL